MNARHLLGGLAAITLVGLSACKNSSNARPPEPLTTRPAQAAEAKSATRPDTMDAAVSAPNLIARKAENYAQTLETMLARRGEPRPGGAATRPAAEPSEVQWGEPAARGAARATGTGDAGTAAVRPVGDSPNSPSANQVAMVQGDPAVARPVAAARPSALEALEARLAQRSKDSREVAAHLDHQLLAFLKEESVPQLDALSALPQEDREMLAALFDSLTQFRNAVRADNNMLLSRKVRPLIELSDRLRGQADLVIPTAALCTRVDGFGVYEPLEPARFIAGKEHPVIIYCEVENFASRQNEKKQWETSLKQEEVLYTETGMQVWPEKPAAKTITDLSRNRRHDFFVVKLVKLPANLTIGRYLLKVSVQDQQASRIAEATIPIQIVAE